MTIRNRINRLRLGPVNTGKTTRDPFGGRREQIERDLAQRRLEPPSAATRHPFEPEGEWADGHPEDLTGPGYTEPPTEPGIFARREPPSPALYSLDGVTGTVTELGDLIAAMPFDDRLGALGRIKSVEPPGPGADLPYAPGGQGPEAGGSAEPGVSLYEPRGYDRYGYDIDGDQALYNAWSEPRPVEAEPEHDQAEEPDNGPAAGASYVTTSAGATVTVHHLNGPDTSFDVESEEAAQNWLDQQFPLLETEREETETPGSGFTADPWEGQPDPAPRKNDTRFGPGREYAEPEPEREWDYDEAAPGEPGYPGEYAPGLAEELAIEPDVDPENADQARINGPEADQDDYDLETLADDTWRQEATAVLDYQEWAGREEAEDPGAGFMSAPVAEEPPSGPEPGDLVHWGDNEPDWPACDSAEPAWVTSNPATASCADCRVVSGEPRSGPVATADASEPEAYEVDMTDLEMGQ